MGPPGRCPTSMRDRVVRFDVHMMIARVVSTGSPRFLREIHDDRSKTSDVVRSVACRAIRLAALEAEFDSIYSYDRRTVARRRPPGPDQRDDRAVPRQSHSLIFPNR